METALREITLVLFTTIAPAGAIGFFLSCCGILKAADKAEADALSRYLVVPLALVIFGLILSATNLGTPANALYVLTGVNRSPLSNEVISAVVFLVIGGVYWIVSFLDVLKEAPRRTWVVVAAVASLVFVWFVSQAYSVATVPTWNLPTAPVTLWLNAVSSGVFVALFTACMAKRSVSATVERVLLVVVCVAVAANAVVLGVEWEMMADIVTTTASARALAPHFPLVIGAYVVLCLLGVVLVLAKGRFSVRHRLAVYGVAGCLALVGCFAVRFEFYVMHMTIGIS